MWRRAASERRARKIAVALAVSALACVAVVALVARHGPAALLGYPIPMLRQQQLEFGLEDPWVGISRAASGPDPWEMSYPEEHRFWSEFHRPNTGYGFDTDIPGGDAIPMYNPDACVPMPYDDLPPGYLCSSPEYGVFALDVYGNATTGGCSSACRRAWRRARPKRKVPKHFYRRELLILKGNKLF